MFLLFFNLYYAMLYGSWQPLTLNNLREAFNPIFNGLGTFLTSIFGDSTCDTLGSTLFSSSLNNNIYQNYLMLIALVLALITSIGIVVMAVKGIKRIFSVFFYGVR